MTLPAILPDWMPWWLQFLLWTGGVILGLATIVMPFIIIGMRGRLTYVSEQLDEVHAELRMLAQRMPEPISAARYEALRAASVSRGAPDDGAYRTAQRPPPPQPQPPPRPHAYERPVPEYDDDDRPDPRAAREQWRDDPRPPARNPDHDGSWQPREQRPDPARLPGARPTLEPRPPLGLPLGMPPGSPPEPSSAPSSGPPSGPPSAPRVADDRRDPPPRPGYYRNDGYDDDGEGDPGYDRRLSPPFRPSAEPRPGPRADPRHEPRLRWPPRED